MLHVNKKQKYCKYYRFLVTVRNQLIFFHAVEAKLNSVVLCCVKAISSTLDAKSNLWQLEGHYINPTKTEQKTQV